MSAARAKTKPPVQVTARSSGRPTLLKRLRALPGKLSGLMPWRRRQPSLASLLLLPDATKSRTRSELKKRRLSLVGRAKRLIADGKPAAAIQLLTKALLEDPHHARYHELLSDAATLRRLKRNKRSGDPLADLHRDIKPLALQLDAFGAYVEELEQLLDKAGIPPMDSKNSKAKGNKSKKARGQGKRESAQS
jgi:hypothetical protein